jgi:hypothetical protein
MVSRLVRFAAAFAAACLAVSFPSTRARACSVCQCGDPLFSSTGSSKQPAGSFSFYLEGLVSTKSSGVLADDPEEPPAPGDRERGFDRELTAFASWTPIPRVTLSASMPFKWITITETHDGASADHDNHGFGDASLYANAVLWQDMESMPMTWVDARAMAKLPTGQSEKTIAGETDPHIQVGTGSWDFGFGLGAGHHFEHFSLYGSAFYRVNRMGSLGYQYGDVFLGNLIATREAFPTFGGVLVRPGAELNLRYAQKDQSHGMNYDHSGGTVMYVTPVLEIPFTRNPEVRAPWLRTAIRMPLGDGLLYGHQHEGFVYTAGVGFAF